jgi:hypothetical protein
MNYFAGNVASIAAFVGLCFFLRPRRRWEFTATLHMGNVVGIFWLYFYFSPSVDSLDDRSPAESFRTYGTRRNNPSRWQENLGEDFGSLVVAIHRSRLLEDHCLHATSAERCGTAPAVDNQRLRRLPLSPQLDEPLEGGALERGKGVAPEAKDA